jgi:hypothetical protein
MKGLIRGCAALLDDLLVVLAQVVSVVISAVEWAVPARTARIVARVALLLALGEVAVLVVSLEVRLALEALGVAVGL